MAEKNTHTTSIGYTTGTFDLTHEGHFRILKFMKYYCWHLIVGLTTDELAVSQKRQCFLNFAHRRSILENCRNVDTVIPHTGMSKMDAWKDLKFNVLFIGSDYKHDPEYKEISKVVKVIYIPRTPNISTTRIIQNLTRRWHVLLYSFQGPLLTDGESVIKTICIGKKEHNSTSDTYNLPIPRPRNWAYDADFKKKKVPNISGVNSNRELLIHSTILLPLHVAWNPVFHVTTPNMVKTDDDTKTTTTGGADTTTTTTTNTTTTTTTTGGTADTMITTATTTESDNNNNNSYRYQALHFDRHENTFMTSCIMMRKLDVTLHDWLFGRKTFPPLKQRSRMYQQVRTITRDLKQYGVVHGDIHLRNLCLDLTQMKVYLIDFGWCTSLTFDLCPKEREQHIAQIDQDWDWCHFKKCLQSYHLGNNFEKLIMLNNQ